MANLLMSAAGTAVTVVIGVAAAALVVGTVILHFVRKKQGKGGCGGCAGCSGCSACCSSRPKKKNKEKK